MSSGIDARAGIEKRLHGFGGRMMPRAMPAGESSRRIRLCRFVLPRPRPSVLDTALTFAPLATRSFHRVEVAGARRVHEGVKPMKVPVSIIGAGFEQQVATVSGHPVPEGCGVEGRDVAGIHHAHLCAFGEQESTTSAEGLVKAAINQARCGPCGPWCSYLCAVVEQEANPRGIGCRPHQRRGAEGVLRA